MQTESTTLKRWLADALMGRGPAWPFAHAEGGAAALALAQAEGVAALLQASLQQSGLQVADRLAQALAAAVHVKAAQSLYRQVQCRAVLAKLADAGIPALVLKGTALAYWAYPEPYLRDSGDIDLLLPSRADVERAVTAIAPLGYTLSDALSPGDLSRFESTCIPASGSGGIEMDLHWRLSNVPLFAFRFSWDELWKQSMALSALAPAARGLSPAFSLLHACMHRSKHIATGPDRMKWLYDMLAMARRFQPGDWALLQEQSARHGVAGVCVVNLQHAEALFGAFVPAAAMQALAAAARTEPLRAARLQRGWYYQLMNWKAFPTQRLRWRWLRQQLYPGADFLRKRHGTRSVVVALWRRMMTGLRRVRD